MGLILDTPGSHLVTQEQLRELPPPISMGSRHRPIPHCDLIDAIVEGAESHGWAVGDTQFGVASKGATFFGTMKLRKVTDLDDLRGAVSTIETAALGPREWLTRGTETMLGVRSSTNETHTPEGIAGQSVTVCSNKLFSGDAFAFKRKSTLHLNLPRMIAEGMERFEAQLETLQSGIVRMTDTALTDTDAKARIFDLFNQSVLPSRLLQPIARYYFHPKPHETDTQPRSLLGLNNACTRSIQTLTPGAAFDAAHRIGHHFKLGVN
jgi:hypothetical protein